MIASLVLEAPANTHVRVLSKPINDTATHNLNYAMEVSPDAGWSEARTICHLAKESPQKQFRYLCVIKFSNLYCLSGSFASTFFTWHTRYMLWPVLETPMPILTKQPTIISSKKGSINHLASFERLITIDLMSFSVAKASPLSPSSSPEPPRSLCSSSSLSLSASSSLGGSDSLACAKLC